MGDNAGSLALANNPCGHQKSKHMDVRLHYIRQLIEDRKVRVVKVSTVDQLADVLTKSLPQAQHEKFSLIILGWSAAEFKDSLDI